MWYVVERFDKIRFRQICHNPDWFVATGSLRVPLAWHNGLAGAIKLSSHDGSARNFANA